MSEKVCRYCKDEFCVNADCPMRADYCPVPDVSGVCKYEERIDKELMTPEQCFAKIWSLFCVPATEKEVAEIFKSLDGILKDNGWAIQHIPQEDDKNAENDRDVTLQQAMKSNENPKYYVGQELSVDDVSKDTRHWKLWRISPDPFNTACAYMNHDHTMIVRFEHGEERGVVSEFDEFQVGDKVHISTVEASDKWVYAGELYGLRRYVTKDEIRRVAFPVNYDWGTVMLNQ